MEKVFFRVVGPDGSGLWYNKDGTPNNIIHGEKFKSLTCHRVPMPECDDIRGWLSATPTLDELKKWFSENDMELLGPLGYDIVRYIATEYRQVGCSGLSHWVISESSSRVAGYIRPDRILLNELKDVFIHGRYWGLCSARRDMFANGYEIDRVGDILEENRPENCGTFGYWWPRGLREPRIEFIDKLIEKTYEN